MLCMSCSQFKEMVQIESLATPTELRTSEPENVGLDTHALATGPTTVASDQKNSWPFTVSELAQNLILTLLRGNSSLCDRVSPSLLTMFTSVANLASDASVSPALDILFIIIRPEVR